MSGKPISHQKIALLRMEKLLVQAELRFKEHPLLSNRYVELARLISMKYKVKFTADQKKLFCKKCDSYLKQGVNSRTRLEHGKIAITCLNCNHVKRIPYKK